MVAALRARLGALAGRAPSSVRDVAWNLSGPVVTTVLLFVTAPAYIGSIGLERYGVMAVIWVLLGYFGFLDLGLSRAAANFAARAEGPAEIERIFSTTVVFNALLGAVGAGALMAVPAGLIAGLVQASPEVRAEMAASLPWLIGFIPLAMVSGIFTGILEGRRRFALSNMIQTLGAVVFQGTPLLAALLVAPRLEVIVPCALLGRGLAIAASAVAAVRATGIRPSLRPDLRLLRRLFAFGGWVSLSSVISPVLTSLDQFLIASGIGVRNLPFFSVPNSIAQRMNILPQAMFRALYPRFARMRAGDQESSDTLGTSVAILSLLLTAIASAGVLLIGPLLTVWLGAAFAAEASTVGRILLLGAWFNGLAILPFVYLEGTGRPHIPALLHLAELPPYVGALLLGLHLFGLEGAAAAAALRMAVDAVLLFAFAGYRWRRLAALLPGLAIVSACLAVAEVPGAPWRIAVALLLAAVAVAAWAYLVRKRLVLTRG